MAVKRFNISLSPNLIIALDAAAAREGVSRSCYIKESIELRLKLDKSVAHELNNSDSSFNAIRHWHLAKMTHRRSLKG